MYYGLNWGVFKDVVQCLHEYSHGMRWIGVNIEVIRISGDWMKLQIDSIFKDGISVYCMIHDEYDWSKMKPAAHKAGCTTTEVFIKFQLNKGYIIK